jgi:hypothetical protein
MSFATERRGYYRRRDTHDSPVAQSLQFFRACGVSNTLECDVVHHSKIASRCPRGVIFDRDEPGSGSCDVGQAPESGRKIRAVIASTSMSFCRLMVPPGR